MEDFKEYYRYKLYERTHILVNKLDDVFKEIELFIELKLKPMMIDSEYDAFIFGSIELKYEHEEFKWIIRLKDEISVGNEIYYDKEFIKEDKEFMKMLEEHDICMFPKILYDEAFLTLTEVVSEYVNKEELQDKLEIYNIMTIDNNGENNIVY